MTLTRLPTDNQAYISVRLSSEIEGLNLTTHPPLQHLRSIWWKFCETCEIDSRSTHGVFGGSFPSFSLSLLCTTKIPNSVRFESRSDSGSS
jgi:hypothetical protein